MTRVLNERSFGDVTERELELLQALPAIVPTTTREFANLANLGLVIVEDETGIVTLTPLGKSWAVTQELLPQAPHNQH